MTKESGKKPYKAWECAPEGAPPLEFLTLIDKNGGETEIPYKAIRNVQHHYLDDGEEEVTFDVIEPGREGTVTIKGRNLSSLQPGG